MKGPDADRGSAMMRAAREDCAEYQVVEVLGRGALRLLRAVHGSANESVLPEDRPGAHHGEAISGQMDAAHARGKCHVYPAIHDQRNAERLQDRLQPLREIEQLAGGKVLLPELHQIDAARHGLSDSILEWPVAGCLAVRDKAHNRQPHLSPCGSSQRRTPSRGLLAVA